MLITALALSGAAHAQDQVVLLADDLTPAVSGLRSMLQAEGYNVSLASSDSFDTVDLAAVDQIWVSACQPSILYSEWNARLTEVEDWVEDGGVVSLHAANVGCGSAVGGVLPRPPGGTPTAFQSSQDELVFDRPMHPIVDDLTDPLVAATGLSLAINVWVDTGESDDVPVISSANGYVVTYTRAIGCGMVVVTGMPLEQLADAGDPAGTGLIAGHIDLLGPYVAHTPGTGADDDGDGIPASCDACPDDVQNDDDFDGVCNSSDLCPDEDDSDDRDTDGFPDACDVCPDDADPLQLDLDDDGVGDVCDACPLDPPNDDDDDDGVCDSDDICPLGRDNLDRDNDGVPNACDVCPDIADDQYDTDLDGVGDACDECVFDPPPHDVDGDTVCNSDDVCRLGDDLVDTDSDGVADACDVCPDIADDQTDTDFDGVGDVCDVCPLDAPDQDLDNDGVCNSDDICPGGDDNVNSDTDSIPDHCDNCPDYDNEQQVDTDGDGRGDPCDDCPLDAFPNDDVDGDGICDSADSCIQSPPGRDSDLDGIEDACDNCVNTPNPSQDDTDLDGSGDACDACPEDYDGGFREYPDADADGFPDLPDLDGDGYPDICDCDIYEPAAYPGAEEICDGIDNDCDNVVDGPDAVGAVIWFADMDGDGWGNLEVTQLACEQPYNFVRNRRDCNDSLPTVNPDGVEVCNERDDDCDGQADEDLTCTAEVDPSVVNQDGCSGCQSSGAGSLGWLGVLLAGVLGRRR